MKNKEKIYSLPDINPSINQIFIDNLNGNSGITINDFLNGSIKDLLQGKENDLNLIEEFNKTLKSALMNELNDKSLDDKQIEEYINELKDFLNEDNEIKKKIISIAYELIEKNKDEDTNCKVLINKIIGEGYVNKYTIDIVSFLIEYIKENIFNTYIKKVLLKLEDNNILTTLIELKRNNFKEIDKSIVRDITIKYLEKIPEEKNKTKSEPKFLYNYNVPGLYNFYKDICDYICKNITSNYFNNEKKLRDALKVDIIDINKFHETENSAITNLEKYINENHKSINGILNKVSHALIFKDYVTYYLQKNRNNSEVYNKDDIYHKLIELLIRLRFKDEKVSLFIKIIWIESNVNYILNILTIFENAMQIFDDPNKLYNKIEELIKENKIKYITNEKKNPEHTKEVNECYYILLASICYIITSDEIKLTKSSSDKKANLINIHHYSSILSYINKILQTLNDDLLIFLNEMYIIDELIKIIDLFIYKNNIEKITDIRNLMRENSLIIQKYSNNKINLSEELPDNIEEIYNLIMKDEIIDKKDRVYKDFYDKLRYILYKEIKKIPDINYRYKILEKLLNSDEMIKKSNDIFQILLKKNYVKKEYSENRNNILAGDDNIIKLLNKKANKNNFALVETLLYFFEKNSLNYLNNIINSKKEIKKNDKKQTVVIKLEDEPLDILKDCYKVLDYYIFEPKKLENKLKEICILFCLGYIKTYIHTFIKTFEDKEPKFKDSKKIIDFINGDKSIYKMMRIFIYKILYNNFGAEVFINEEMMKKYKLKDYKDFKDFIQTKELNKLYKIEYQIRTLKDNKYLESYEQIEKYKKDGFKNKINKRDFDIEDTGFDNFYIISYNLILSDLQMDNSFGNDQFYENICKPLFKDNKDNNLLYEAIQLFYDPTKCRENKNNFKINSNNIPPLLVGYRYSLNELSFQNEKGIYYPLYTSNYATYLTGCYYPGNDTKPNNVYYSIINHFKTRPNEGCYVCLCNRGGFYHSVKSGFPGSTNLNMTCPKCSKNIGTTKAGNYKSKYVIVKRENYFRIFKDENEIKEIKKDAESRKKLNDINYMTLNDYIKKYIINENNNEKGIYIYNDKNYFKNDNKIVRNLSPISFRILNYILYSHLFFARLVTKKNNDFDKYLPRGMSWVETLNQCWIILKNELLKENIDSIEKFMSYIFSDLFPILNGGKKIEQYDSFIKFEDKLESKIKDIIKEYKEEVIKKKLYQKNDEDKTSFISLLKETYPSSVYESESDKYPFYEYFYYTDYLNEEYINKKLKEMDDNKYPVLKQYLNSKYNKENKNNYSLDNLNLFNTVLNLINEEYSNKIPRVFAEKHKLKDLEIYKNNEDLINNFIIFYNKLEYDNNLSISINNPLCDFLLDDNNKFGISYKKIYIKFAKEQNNKLENLLDIKIEKGIFTQNYKNTINIQQINEKEIFTMSLPKKVSFMNILFDSSYRKILDSEDKSNELYKEYEINYDLIEENLTESLLKNKKLLNEDINTISSFIYNNEVFNNQVTDLITLFNKRYNHEPIDLYNQVDLYKFSQDNKNSNLCQDIINDFIILIKYLNDKRKEKNNEDIIVEKAKEDNKDNKENDFKITEETKIYEVVNKLKDSFSNNFIRLFENKDNLTIDKTSDIFTYFLKLNFELVMDELKDYQENLDEESKKKVENYSEKDHPIKKEDFACAIRLFTTLVLFLEKDKEDKIKKIKNNRNNLVNYLKASDLWGDIFTHPDFNKNLNELRDINAKISQIIPLYEALGKDIKDSDYDAVKIQIEKEKQKSENEENISENKNDDDSDEFEKKSEDDDDRD